MSAYRIFSPISSAICMVKELLPALGSPAININLPFGNPPSLTQSIDGLLDNTLSGYLGFFSKLGITFA